jgi:hypothetical protein
MSRGYVTDTDVCIQSAQTVCAVENAQAAAPAAAATSEKRRLRRNAYIATNAKLTLRNRMPVSIRDSGRSRAGSQVNGDRNPRARRKAPTDPEATHASQKNPRGCRRNRTSVVWPDADWSERRRFSASTTPPGLMRHGCWARTKSCEEKTPPVKTSGAKRIRSKARRVAAPNDRTKSRTRHDHPEVGIHPAAG